MTEDFRFPSEKPRLFDYPRRDVPLIGILGGEYGKEIDAEIQGKYGKFKIFPKTFIKERTNNQIRIFPNLEGFEEGDEFRSTYTPGRDDLIGKLAKCFYTVAVQEFLSTGMHVATLGNLEKSLQMKDSLDMLEESEDLWTNKNLDLVTGFVLRGQGEPHYYLARSLINQIPESNLPVMISLKDLEILEDQESPYKLSFKLKEDAKIIGSEFFKGIDSEGSLGESDCIFYKAHYLDIDLNTGLPKRFLKETSYTPDNGGWKIFRGEQLIEKEEYYRLFRENSIRRYSLPKNSHEIQALSPVSVQKGIVSLDSKSLFSGSKHPNWVVAIVSPGKEE